jgi:hypothetical protein
MSEAGYRTGTLFERYVQKTEIFAAKTFFIIAFVKSASGAKYQISYF